MSEITVQGLLTDAGIIRGEIHDSQNSHDRVGKMFEDIIKYIQAHESSWATGGGGGGGGTSSITGTLLLNGLNGKDNPSSDDQILHWSSNTGWGYITTPTGGSGTGGGVTWQQLRANTSEQIDASHLSDALSNYVAKANMAGTNAVYEWWGNKFPATPSNGVYKINGAIEFSNGVRIAPEDNNHTLRIEARDNSSNPAHIYATGGVSALGNSSSGGGGGEGEGEGTPLNNLLGYINSHDYYGTTGTVSPSTGDTIIYNGTKWKVGSIDLEDLLGTAPAQFVASKILAKDSGDNYKWIDASGIGGSTSITNLWEVGDVGTDSGYTNTPIADGHILQYGNSKWNNIAFGINAGTANSILSSITLGGNTYSLPQANGNAMGIVKAGNGLSADSGTMSLTPATLNTIGGIQVFGTGSSSITPQSGTTTHKYYGVYLDGSNKAYVDVPWTDYDHTYEGGYGITVSGTANGQTGNYPISVDLAKNSSNENISGLGFDDSGRLKISWSRTLWGNTDNLTNSIGSSKSNLADINWATNVILRSANIAISPTLFLYYPNEDNDTNSLMVRQLAGYSEIWNKKGSPIHFYNGSSYTAFGAYALPDTETADGRAQASYINGSRVWVKGSLVVGEGITDTSNSITLGGAVLKWDETNKALYVQRKDGSAANFYATGGVSALGFSDGTGSVGAMTFGSINIDDKIIFKDVEDTSIECNQFGDLHISATNDIHLDSYTWAGDLSASRISVGNGGSTLEKIWIDGGKLKLMVGTTTYTFNPDQTQTS